MKRDDARERARKMRREAYQRAKAEREADPEFRALKEEAKRQRREAYLREKEKAKGEAVRVKAEQKREREQARTEARAAADRELMKLITVTTPNARGSNALN